MENKLKIYGVIEKELEEARERYKDDPPSKTTDFESFDFHFPSVEEFAEKYFKDKKDDRK